MTTREIQLDAALKWLATQVQTFHQRGGCTIICPYCQGKRPGCIETVDDCAYKGTPLPCRVLIYEAALTAVGGADAEHKGGLAAIVGKWPGDETDAEIEEALEGLRGTSAHLGEGDVKP